MMEKASPAIEVTESARSIRYTVLFVGQVSVPVLL